MVGRTFDAGNSPHLNGAIYLRTQTRLTKEEASVCARDDAALERHQAGAGGQGQAESHAGSGRVRARVALVTKEMGQMGGWDAMGGGTSLDNLHLAGFTNMV